MLIYVVAYLVRLAPDEYEKYVAECEREAALMDAELPSAEHRFQLAIA